MNGIEPPSPQVMGGLPKNAFDARSTDCSSHEATGGASHPPPPFSGSKRTCAPYGGSDSRSSLSLPSMSFAAREGGVGSESLVGGGGRRTLPPCTRSGRPAWPVYDSPRGPGRWGG